MTRYSAPRPGGLIQIKDAVGGRVTLVDERETAMEEGLQLLYWLLDQPIWAMILGACLSLFAVALFLKLRRSNR
jgi:hypothetical protein